MATELWVASTDVCKTCGRLWMERMNLKLRNENLDGARWIFVDSDGVWRSWRDFFCGAPSVFRWVCVDACPTSVRGILIFEWSGCLTICELCCVPTSCPVYCLALPLPVSPPPQKSTSKICKLLPVVISNVKKTKASNPKKRTGFPKNRAFLFLT